MAICHSHNSSAFFSEPSARWALPRPEVYRFGFSKESATRENNTAPMKNVHVQLARKPCSITAESQLNFNGIGAQTRRFWRSFSTAYTSRETAKILRVNTGTVYSLWSNGLLDYWCIHKSLKTNMKAIGEFLEKTKNTELNVE